MPFCRKLRLVEQAKASIAKRFMEVMSGEDGCACLLHSPDRLFHPARLLQGIHLGICMSLQVGRIGAVPWKECKADASRAVDADPIEVETAFEAALQAFAQRGQPFGPGQLRCYQEKFISADASKHIARPHCVTKASRDLL